MRSSSQGQVNPDVMPLVGELADALRSAQRAVKLAEGADFGHLDTLACAQFANGMIEESIETAGGALEMAHDGGAGSAVIAEIEEHLLRFEAAR